MERQIYCNNCELEIEESSDFCPRCGTLFNKDVKCTNHPSTDAQYVCVICAEPLCKRCGSVVNDIFLCAAHEHYEVYEEMVRVYGSSDVAQVNYRKLHQCILGGRIILFSVPQAILTDTLLMR